jgi:hypothetical protein
VIFFLTNCSKYDTIDSSKRGRKQKCVNVLTAEAPHRFAKSASICIFADADTSGRMMTMKQQKPTTICSVKILRDGKGNAVKIIKIRG